MPSALAHTGQLPNPSVKGTSCGKPQDVPYLERWRILFYSF